MKEDNRKLLLEIARDPEFAGAYRNVLSGMDVDHDYSAQAGAHRAARAQAEKLGPAKRRKKPDMQLPEPWSGDIERCRILFIGNHPPVDEWGKCPTAGVWGKSSSSVWGDDEVVDFFAKRFQKFARRDPAGGRWEIMDEAGAMRYCGYRSPTWELCYNGARVLLGGKVIPGVDYAVTDIAHCKTKRYNCMTTAKCMTTAYIESQSDRWLRRIIKAAEKLEYVWVYGEPAKKVVEYEYFKGEDQEFYREIPASDGNGRELTFIFWRDPTEFIHPGVSSFEGVSRVLVSWGSLKERGCGGGPKSRRSCYLDVCEQIAASGDFYCSRSRAPAPASLRIWPKNVVCAVDPKVMMGGKRLSVRGVCLKKKMSEDRYMIRVYSSQRHNESLLNKLQSAIGEIYPAVIEEDFCTNQSGSAYSYPAHIDIVELDRTDDISLITEICQYISSALEDCKFWK